MANDIEFALGDMGEGSPWRIAFDVDVAYGGEPCRHCHSDRIETKPNAYGGTYKVRHWTCPRTVEARNEGGFNSTAVCLDCILEAVEAHALSGATATN